MKEVGLPKKATLMFKGSDIAGLGLSKGVKVKTGQLIGPVSERMLSPVTGAVSDLEKYVGYLQQEYIAVTIEVSEDEPDEAVLGALGNPTLETARDLLGTMPGKPDFAAFFKLQPPVNTILVSCLDEDLLIQTNTFLTRTHSDTLVEGIGYLKRVTKVNRVILAVSSELKSLVEGADCEVLEITPSYPNTLDHMIVGRVLEEGASPGKRLEEMGFGFISAEAVIRLAEVFGQGTLPVDKVVTVIGKDNVPVVVKARIGTPIKDILDSLGMKTAHGDRLIMGGPMRGQALYREDLPITAATDGLMVQDKKEVVLSTDGQCINCGECVRACPVRIPVNMLVRVLAKGQYEDAVSMYDLNSCIECGLCNYVCVCRIPIFHHIMLGKQEVARIAEEANG